MKDLINIILSHISLKTLLIVVAFLSLIILRFLFKKIKLQSPYDDLIDASRNENCSEYEIFKRAAKEWDFTEGKTREDFKRYLWYGEIPRYVKDYVQKILKKR